ncbi:blue copper domain protein [Halorubrum distributum JCM 10247]|uniref:Blue copper domain protein n=2 Tax=Halorubrum distributum TaxID=29283 RepID=M0DU20_9EURY|nr:blue copper domain protein [Halorubrum terrestre JCM 10247]
MRIRLDDAFTLGIAGHAEAGASVGQNVFARFEGANGEYGAHEFLETTSKDNYEGFEEDGLVVMNEGLSAGDVEAARGGWEAAHTNLREATVTRVGETGANALEVLRFGTAVNNVELLAAAGDTEGAASVGQEVLGWWETSTAHDAVESADSETYETLEGAMEDAISAAQSGDIESLRSATNTAVNASATGAYAVAASEELAGAGQIASYQGQGWDAAALASMGGPSTEFAHAAALTIYRARIHDAAWLYERGHAEAARQRVENVFAHFEGARAHEALEEASEDAYTRFEDDGLSALSTAIENDDAEGVASAIETINDALVEGIEALGSSAEPALLEAGYFKARIEDAHERYRLGEGAVAAETARGLFETFEANEADFHETLEETDESLYETFEEEHLNRLITALEEGNDAAVDEHVSGIRETLLTFETAAGSTAQVSAVESGYMAARAFDTGVLDVLGENERAGSLVQAAFQHFEAGAGGFHEALEEADHDRYEFFEAALDDASSAAQEGGNVGEQSRAFNDEAVAAIYAVVESGGGSFGGAATSIMQDTFAAFEEAEVHEMLEEADESAYEGYESALNDYIGAIESGSGVGSAATAYADASIRAQFAVVGAVDEAPVGEGSGGKSGGGSEETDLQGGPNIQDGVPDDADHVVNMQAVAFEPEELTIQQGDTVAWEHAVGEPHNVVAYEGEIPEDAEYWASGGFESEEAAREGWEEGEGAVQSGQSYVHTFEATGTHEYFCVPHEAVGMVGSVIVE